MTMLQPLADRLIIKQVDAQEQIKGGIIVSTQKERLPRGTVLFVGPDVKEIKVGDEVVMTEKWFQPFKHNGEEFIVINEPDVIAKVIME